MQACVGTATHIPLYTPISSIFSLSLPPPSLSQAALSSSFHFSSFLPTLLPGGMMLKREEEKEDPLANSYPRCLCVCVCVCVCVCTRTPGGYSHSLYIFLYELSIC